VDLFLADTNYLLLDLNLERQGFENPEQTAQNFNQLELSLLYSQNPIYWAHSLETNPTIQQALHILYQSYSALNS
jgi:hypothetical protein